MMLLTPVFRAEGGVGRNSSFRSPSQNTFLEMGQQYGITTKTQVGVRVASFRKDVETVALDDLLDSLGRPPALGFNPSVRKREF